MNLSDDQKKELTEKLLDEKWHDHQRTQYCDGINGGRCKITSDDNRDFDTWKDVGDCLEKLVEKEMWEEFYLYTTGIYHINNPVNNFIFYVNFMIWLFREVDEKGEPHFCRLVAEFRPWRNE